MSAPTRRFRPGGGLGPLVVLLALGLALRLIIAYVLAPGSGFGVDVASFRFWANDLATHGPYGFYGRGFFVDYTPGYLYVLWLVGFVGNALGGIGDLVKLPAILADAVLAGLVYRLVLELGASRRAALVGAALVLANPVTWFDSAVWGQVDSVGTIVLLLGLWALWRDQPELATIGAVAAAVVKPQLGILLPIVAAVLLRRALFPPGDRPRDPLRLVSSAAAGLATAVLLCLPFGLSLPDLLAQVVKTAGGYPYLTVNAYNPWALVGDAGRGLAAGGTWIPDVSGVAPDGTPLVGFMIGPLPAVTVGTALLLVVVLLTAALAFLRDDRLTVLVSLTVLAIAFFVVPTRVHERYLFPFFALGAILGAASVRWRWAFVLLAAASFANLYAILTLPFYRNPGVADWLGLGDTIRSPGGVAVVALAHLAVFGWAIAQLRAGAVTELAAEATTTAETAETASGGSPAELPPVPVLERLAGFGRDPQGSGAAAAGAGAPAATRGGEVPGRPVSRSASDDLEKDAAGIALPAEPPLGPPADDPWDRFVRRLTTRPIRTDRSAGLATEGRGRLDRLDLWVFVVLVVAVLVLRVFRLPEPYSMHFDEVYHARTATEFLQDWRYGEQHAIYEYTHPHLAKYLMAVGLVLWGDDAVTASSAVGASVRDAALEPRYDDPTLPGGRGGDRLYVVTGSELRVYDLATRATVAALAVPGASTVSVDATSHRLFVGTDGGDVLTIDSGAFDARRLDAPAAIAAPRTVAHLGGPIRRLYAADGGDWVLALLPDDQLASVDVTGGATAGTLHLVGAADFAPAGSVTALFASPAQVPDRAAAARTLAGLVGGDAGRYEQALAATHDIVIQADVSDAQRASVQAAIADGRLVGFSFRSLPRVAVATASGVSLFDPATARTTATLGLPAPATGLVATSGLDAPRLYVADGRSVAVVKLGALGVLDTSPTVETTIPMPGPVSRVTFDPASVMVHVLGRTPDGSADTVYVIEPHGNAVYADARLPFAPVAWATDANQQYPAADREQLLAFSATGQAVTVDLGSHAFAWRLPGVIAGALMAGLLYLLARLLFRRRAVGLLIGLFTLVDGMFFVQSRIGMNDTYVGLFIVAAYVVFAALWLGAWRRRWTFWLAMPLIGLLLGLGLASKWVALYSIGGIAILILARSALGRILVVLGLVLGTAVLGYMAIAEVPAGATGGANLSYLLLMIGLTLAATVVVVLRPIRWTLEEIRFAVGGPLVAGALLFAAALPLHLSASTSTLVMGAATGLVGLALLAAVGFWLAARWGFGPLAPPPAPDDPVRFAEPAAPAPEGWLRPGWAYGLPVAWMGLCLLVLPIVVYVVAYVPWALINDDVLYKNLPLLGTWPPGHNGQTLVQLTQAMYDYHNNLRVGHPASSPWWAWPFDLKPVWFYQGSFAASTAASIYDGGNLVLWWLAVPATAFVAWQAFKRRSLGLALILVAFLTQWLGWSRIDRATFQYHWYTSLPFFLLALAYFVAELWHGPSRRTWLLARVSAALAVVGPPLLWFLKTPLCTFVRVDAAYPDSPACGNTAGDLVVTQRIGGIVVVMAVAIVALLIQLVRLERAGRLRRDEAGRRLAVMAATAVVAAVALVAAGAVLGDGVLLALPSIRAEGLALLLAVPLGLVALVVLTARDPRRFAVGIAWAAVLDFIVFYPNIAALPLPSVLVNAYQGLLPTWLYVWQFPVNTEAAVSVRLLDGPPLVLLLALLVTVVVLGYATWVWRIVLAERRALRADERLAGGSSQVP
ncbi:MAG TPA: phospholipid carrier-dependent glycosyltransferase [Candidatus Limnocylindrales bacterium]